MQGAFTAQGEGAFDFQALETVTDENLLLVESRMHERAVHWLQTLGAEPVIG